MLALKVEDIRDFMTKLLAKDTFDTFLFSEGTITTFTTYVIDGTWHPEYFQDSESDQGQVPAGAGSGKENQTLTWHLVRPVLYDMIKGNHTPVHMKIVMKLADYNVEDLLKQSGLSIMKEQVDGLYLNLTYTKGTVTVTTGSSLKIFTLDKSLDRVWDDMIRRFFLSRQITCKSG